MSFSDDDYGDMFITQSSFSNVDTQGVCDAVEYLEGIGTFNVSDNSASEQRDMQQFSDEVQNSMCKKIFDFSEDVDNGWSVSTQNDPIIVTRNRDGKQFVINGADDTSAEQHKVNEEIDENLSKSQENVFDKEIEADMKRFSSIVGATELDESKRKRLVI